MGLLNSSFPSYYENTNEIDPRENLALLRGDTTECRAQHIGADFFIPVPEMSVDHKGQNQKRINNLNKYKTSKIKPTDYRRGDEISNDKRSILERLINAFTNSPKEKVEDEDKTNFVAGLVANGFLTMEDIESGVEINQSFLGALGANTQESQNPLLKLINDALKSVKNNLLEDVDKNTNEKPYKTSFKENVTRKVSEVQAKLQTQQHSGR